MNLPNKLTLIRIAMIPVFLFFLMCDFVPYSNYIALAIFILASVTDSLDGQIARKTGQITDFGKFADPLADKILVLSALIGLIELDQIGAIPVIVIIAREFMVTGLRIVAIGSGKVIAAGFSGKLKTVTQMLVVILLLVAQPIRAVYPSIELAVQISIWLMVGITVYSGIEYMVQNWHVVDYRK